MKLSDRLSACASLVKRGNVAADVGTDHGYLALYLLEEHICPHVYASDLREGPLSAARRSAQRAGVTEHITFCLSDGLKSLPVEQLQTVICAGMGGDTIISILEAEPRVQRRGLQLILQPQSKAGDLREYLARKGFSILREKLSVDGKFLYTSLEAEYTGEVCALTPGQRLVSQGLLQQGDPLLGDYLRRLLEGTRQTISGLRQAKEPDQAQVQYYLTVEQELLEMEAEYVHGE